MAEGEVIDFDVMSEKWNVYELNDERPVKIKGKIVLMKVSKFPVYNPSGDPIYGTASQTIFATFATKEMKGRPSFPPPSLQQISASITRELDFKVIEEHWNEYQFRDGTVHRLKLVITGVQKTSLFAGDGDPIYYILSQTVGRMIVPPELKRKSSPPTPPNLGYTK